MQLALRSAYWDDAQAREAFKQFIHRIHGLNFAEWEEGGYWDDAYRPFSFFDGRTIVSSVCIYSLDVVVEGRRTRLAQISGVGTLPEYRRHGLNRRLTDAGLDWAGEAHEGVFLFADAEAAAYYEACGFAPIDEYLEFVEAPRLARIPGAVRLDPGNRSDRQRIYEYALRRAPVSRRFGVLNAKLVMFHVLHSLRNCVYEIPDLDCLVMLARNGDRLSIFDVVGERIPLLEEIGPYIAEDQDRIVEFHFHADRLGIEDSKSRLLRGNHPFVKGPFPLPRPVFPYTCRA